MRNIFFSFTIWRKSYQRPVNCSINFSGITKLMSLKADNALSEYDPKIKHFIFQKLKHFFCHTMIFFLFSGLGLFLYFSLFLKIHGLSGLDELQRKLKAIMGPQQMWEEYLTQLHSYATDKSGKPNELYDA